MNPNQVLWEKGDFTRLANTMRTSGDELVESLGVKPGMKVLDLGSGDGTTALPEAQHGADVLGVDIARNLVEAGNLRAKAAGLANLRFQEGDACDLRPLADDSFDLVVRVFGAMFAPKPFEVAKEMVRVTKPGGASSWATDSGRPDPGGADPEGQLGVFAAAARRVHQPDDLGRGEQRARARFAAAGVAADAVLRTRHLSPSTSPARARNSSRCSGLLRADDECLRGRRQERSRRRLAGRVGDAVHEPEQERARRSHCRAGDLPAGDGRGALAAS
jgi:hypothetical protein